MTANLQALMNDVGPLDDDIEAVTQNGEEVWIIRFAALDVVVEPDPNTGRLMLSTLLPPAPDDRRVAVYEALLLYTGAWRETGGVRMALMGSNGPLVQIADLSMAELDARTLVTVARNLVSRGIVWTQFLLGRTAEGNADTTAAAPPFQADYLIRA